MDCKLSIAFLLSLLTVLVQAIDLKPIRVPSIVTEGSSIYLECKFDLEGFNLHAVKWRKNRGLFYKYQPDDPHGVKRSYPIHGVNVNLRYSNETHVFLEDVDFNTQGTYSCDVISKDPFQKEVSSEDQITVVHSDFLFTPLGATGPRSQQIKHVHVADKAGVHTDVHIAGQGSAIVAPETQKERTVTTTLKKSSTLLSHNPHGTPLTHGELENVRSRLSNTVDLTKLKNRHYDQHHDYLNHNGRLHFDEHGSRNVKTVETDYFPVELGPSRIVQHSDGPHGEHKVTTIKKTILSPKATSDEINLSQRIKLVDPHHPIVDPHHPVVDAHHPIIKHDPHHKSARYEVEEDGVAFNNEHHHHHPAAGGVFSLSPDQYNDFNKFKFVAREPSDVVLFKPVANQSHSSTAFDRQPSWLLLHSVLFIILIVNNLAKKY